MVRKIDEKVDIRCQIKANISQRLVKVVIGWQERINDGTYMNDLLRTLFRVQRDDHHNVPFFLRHCRDLKENELDG